MVEDLKAARKAYRAPAFEVLDPSAAQARLVSVEASNDSSTQEMLSAVKGQLEKQKSAEPSPALSLSPP